MRRYPITVHDEPGIPPEELEMLDIPREGACPCLACREAHAQVVQWREQRPKEQPLCVFGPTREPWTPKDGFNVSDCLCIASIVAFAGWVAIEIWRGW